MAFYEFIDLNTLILQRIYRLVCYLSFDGKE